MNDERSRRFGSVMPDAGCASDDIRPEALQIDVACTRMRREMLGGCAVAGVLPQKI